ncbi:zinc protease [Bradyrhizobium shewense]|uniref:Zinc protease n=2 Tax=Bradyrhizobium shewense TaxID=1761772 RepID=A0A1C3XU09_9BRAD|nr:zinc protease [Bradyrhizobium shewense]
MTLIMISFLIQKELHWSLQKLVPLHRPNHAGNNAASNQPPHRAFVPRIIARVLSMLPTSSSPSVACLLALALTCAFLTDAVSAETPSNSVPPTTFTLNNGLQVVVIPDHRTPVVTQMIWYKAGSADETPGKSGLAHFLEHLMFKGTEKHPVGEFSETVHRIGGNENASTSLDYTNYYQRVPREQLPTVMEFEADRMTSLVLRDENVLPERDVVLEERNMRVANSPAARLSEQIQRALYLNHPYGRPVIGWRQEIEKLDREDALAFYRRFYAPNNAILVIAGDVDVADVRPLVERNFGPIPAQPAIPAQRIRPQEPEPAAPRTVTLSDPRVEQPSLRRHYVVPSAMTAAAGEGAALHVLAQLMGGDCNSYLYRALVVDKPLAVSASAIYRSMSLDSGEFSISASPKQGVSFADVEQAIDDVIADIVKNPIRAEDLERAKTQLIAGAIYAQDDQAVLASVYGSALTIGLSIEHIRSWPDRIRAVTAEQVRAAAQKWLEKKRSVTGYLIKDVATAKPEEKRS